MRRSLVRRLARLGAERVTPQAVQAAYAALDRGERPEGRAAELARYMRACILCIEAQTCGAGEVTDDIVARLRERGEMSVQAADLEAARAMLAGDPRARGADGLR